MQPAVAPIGDGKHDNEENKSANKLEDNVKRRNLLGLNRGRSHLVEKAIGRRHVRELLKEAHPVRYRQRSKEEKQTG